MSFGISVSAICPPVLFRLGCPVICTFRHSDTAVVSRCGVSRCLLHFCIHLSRLPCATVLETGQRPPTREPVARPSHRMPTSRPKYLVGHRCIALLCLVMLSSTGKWQLVYKPTAPTSELGPYHTPPLQLQRLLVTSCHLVQDLVTFHVRCTAAGICQAITTSKPPAKAPAKTASKAATKAPAWRSLSSVDPVAALTSSQTQIAKTVKSTCGKQCARYAQQYGYSAVASNAVACFVKQNGKKLSKSECCSKVRRYIASIRVGRLLSRFAMHGSWSLGSVPPMSLILLELEGA